MANDTPTLALKQYESTEDMDYNDVNNDNATLDTLPPVVCTSTTRPTSNLYQGRFAWESDTRSLIMYDATLPGWRKQVTTDLLQARLMKRTTTLPVPDGSTTIFFGTFQTTVYNVGAVSYSAGMLIPSFAGLYQWSASVDWQAVAAATSGIGRRRIYVKVNGTNADGGMVDNIPGSGVSLNSDLRMSAGGFINLAANDQVQLYAFNSTGQPATIEVNAEFGIARIA